MIMVRPQDTLHKAHLLRLLTEIVDDSTLSHSLRFKGGTCAAMIGILDRFSVDLDFDLVPQIEKHLLRKLFHDIFSRMNLSIKDESKLELEFFVKYNSKPQERNTIKIDALNIHFNSSRYAPIYLSEINRTVVCQTIDTIVANKLVAPLDRFEKNKTIAGRDIYDIHHFLLHGLPYNKPLIRERTHLDCKAFFQKLIAFIEKYITETVINEDLNALLPPAEFQRLRKILKTETLLFLAQEMQRLSHGK
jgi:predicted nucleotidyltransferase component of viral defense system